MTLLCINDNDNARSQSLFSLDSEAPAAPAPLVPMSRSELRDLFPSYFTNNQINLLCVRYESQPALEEGVCIDIKFKKPKLLTK